MFHSKTIIISFLLLMNISLFSESIWDYASRNDIEKVKTFIETVGFNINSTDEYGRNLLHTAVKNKESNELITYLIDKGININLQDKDLAPPVYYAFTHNNIEGIQILLSYNVNIYLNFKKSIYTGSFFQGVGDLFNAALGDDSYKERIKNKVTRFIDIVIINWKNNKDYSFSRNEISNSLQILKLITDYNSSY